MRKAAARLRRTEFLAVSGVGKAVRKRRTDLRMTQVQLAEAIGTTQDYISKLEIGEYLTPGRDTLMRISSALDIPVEELERAAAEVSQRALNQVEQAWAVSTNPLSDLLEVTPFLDKQDITALVRMARVLAAGKHLKVNGN